jgi:hypothetical protein
MKHKLLISVIAGWVLALCASNTLAAKDKVYTWTDGKGVVHYGERPPKDSQAALVKTRTGHSESIPATTTVNATTTTSKNAAPETTIANSLKDPERCNVARKNLEVLNSVARIRVPGDDGNMRTLTEDDKVNQRATMQEIIDQACE